MFYCRVENRLQSPYTNWIVIVYGYGSVEDPKFRLDNPSFGSLICHNEIVAWEMVVTPAEIYLHVSAGATNVE
jgi:hypothetical protein